MSGTLESERGDGEASSLAPEQQQQQKKKEELGREETESHDLMRDKAAIHTRSTPCLHRESTCVCVGRREASQRSVLSRIILIAAQKCPLTPGSGVWFPLRLTCYPSRIRIEEGTRFISSDQQSNMRCKVASSSRGPCVTEVARGRSGDWRGREQVTYEMQAKAWWVVVVGGSKLKSSWVAPRSTKGC